MAETKREYAPYLLKGVLFGIGFVAVVILGTHYVAHLIEKPLTVVVDNALISKPSDQALNLDFKKDLTIVSYVAYKVKSRASSFKILGKIKNNGTAPWTSIEIQAEFFNKGEFVDECMGHIRVLQPKEVDNFELSCGECGADAVPEHDKTIVKVSAAFRPRTTLKQGNES